MQKNDFLEEWKKLKGEKIEDVNQEKIKKLNQEVMKVDLNRIRPMPYTGDIGKEKNEVVEYKYPELVALCPMTGILDLYHLTIRYIPDEKVPELKSLKFYFLDFRDLPISHENLIAKIYHDFKDVVEPKKLCVELSVNTRGGIKTDIKRGDEIKKVGRKRIEELK